MDEVRLANLAVVNHLACLLHERIAAVIEGDGIDNAGLARGVDKRTGVFRVQREGLVRHDVFPVRKGRHDDRDVKVVGRGVVNNMHVGIGRESLVAAVRLGDAERVGLRAGRAIGARGDCNHIHESQAPHRIDVMRPDKSRPHQAHPDTAHAYASAARMNSRPFLTSSTGVPAPLYRTRGRR